PADATRIAERVKSEYPLAQLYVRAFDREHAVELVHLGVDYQIREMLESAFVFGYETLVGLGVDEEEAADILQQVRERDKARFELDIAGGLSEGATLMFGNVTGPRPTPSFKPRQKSTALNPEAAEILQKAQPVEDA
ncbi:MAG TPA: potassium transporter, partial [Pelagibacterium sp.]|nr:potassium transporter [Pelagibacterium sp.]